jgi:hypothetical protein
LSKHFPVLEDILRHPIVSHCLALFAVWLERAHAPDLEIRSIRIVDLEVQGVVIDEGKKSSPL